MSKLSTLPPWVRQGTSFVLVGLLQLLLDWAVFVTLSGWGIPPATANVIGRVAGAALGFWLNGRITFARDGSARLGWRRFGRFAIIWLILTVISTLLITGVDKHLGLQQAWLAKPMIEAALAVMAFFLWRNVVYR